MHTTPSFTKANSQLELVTTLTALIADHLSLLRAGSTVIQAGHYHLGWNPGIACDPFDQRYAQKSTWLQKASFANSTWQASCSALQQTRSSAKLMTLVNDWQLLQSPVGTTRERESEAAMLRTEYYQRVSTIPAVHMQMLADSSLSSEVIFRESDSRWLFSEKKLRYDLNRTLRHMLRNTKHAELVGLRRELTGNGEPVIYATTEDNHEHKLLYCGHTGCAGEVVQLFSELQTRQVRNFINLYPIECRDPVGAGTQLAQNLFGLADMDITNIAIKPLENGGAEICVEKF